MDPVTMAAFSDEMQKIALGAPLLMAGLGAGIGAGTGAATARPGEERWRAALRGAGVGALAGGAGGLMMRGGARGAKAMKVNLAQPVEATGKRRLFGLMAPKQVSKMTMQEAGERGLQIAPTARQTGVLAQHGKKMLIGAGVGTLGAAGAGVVGSRGVPAASQYLQQRASAGGGGGYYR